MASRSQGSTKHHKFRRFQTSRCLYIQFNIASVLFWQTRPPHLVAVVSRCSNGHATAYLIRLYCFPLHASRSTRETMAPPIGAICFLTRTTDDSATLKPSCDFFNPFSIDGALPLLLLKSCTGPYFDGFDRKSLFTNCASWSCFDNDSTWYRSCCRRMTRCA